MQKPTVSDRHFNDDPSLSRLSAHAITSLTAHSVAALSQTNPLCHPLPKSNRLPDLEMARYPSGTIVSVVVSAMLVGAMAVIGVLQVVSAPSTQLLPSRDTSTALPDTTVVAH